LGLKKQEIARSRGKWKGKKGTEENFDLREESMERSSLSLVEGIREEKRRDGKNAICHTDFRTGGTKNHGKGKRS